MTAAIMVQMGKNGGTVEKNMFKHMAMNSLRKYRVKWGAKYGELVIACESAKNWRREVFPYYKQNRQTDREESTLDWEAIFEAMHEVRSDLINYFPYPTISVLGCEADDIIGALCNQYGSELPGGEPILILSGDKDFRQLQVYMNVDQYDPVRERSMNENNPVGYLTELIIRGDKGDGVPNILSADNSLVLKIRQGTLSAKRLEEYTKSASSNDWSSPELKRNWLRNEQLIDLAFTPENLQQEAVAAYEAQKDKSDRSQLFNYFIKNRMKHLMEYIGDF